MGKQKIKEEVQTKLAAVAQPTTTLRYYQIKPVLEVLGEWWRIKGLPIPFQRAVLRTMRAVEKEREVMSDLHKKLLDEFTIKDEKGEPLVNEETQRYVFADEKGFNASWEVLSETEFTAPGLVAEEVFALDGPLELTLAVLGVLYNEDGENSVLVDA